MTPAPGLDLTYVLPTDEVNEVNRAAAWSLEASGKGVNISRCLATTGHATVAVFTSGGRTGDYLTGLLDIEGIAHRRVDVDEDTRINTTVLRPADTSKFNAPTPRMTAPQLDALVAACGDALATAGPGPSWLAVCGSMPLDAPEGLVGRLVAVAIEHGARCAVDTSGAALRAAIASGADLVAPNVAELAEVSSEVRRVTGAGIEALGAATAAYAVSCGVTLLVSCGAGGAVWTDGRMTLHAQVDPLVPVNTAGAGDALLAGWLADIDGQGGAGGPAGETEAARRLARAVAWGTAACLSRTTVFAAAPPPDEIEAVRVVRLAT